MKGFPKKIATGQDLFNCLSLVQAGELPAAELAAAIQAVEEREYLTVPVLEMSEDRKTVVIAECAEATEGVKVKNTMTTTISAVSKLEAATLDEPAAMESAEIESGAVPSGRASLVKAGTAAALEETGPATEAAAEGAAEQAGAERVTLTLSRPLPEGTTALKIVAAQSPYEVLGITADEVKSIKGVLKNYE